jgi:hypothetical protein
LVNLIERRRRFTDGRSVRPHNPLEREVRYLPCPASDDLMNRKNYGGTSGIVVDYCGTHGVWFHAGALPRLLSFVARGGLADGRRIRLGLPRPKSDAERRLAAEQIAQALRSTPENVTGSTEPVLGVAAGIAESTLDLLETVGDFILDSD